MFQKPEQLSRVPTKNDQNPLKVRYQFERDKLLQPFDRNHFDTDINFLVEHKIFTTATNILVDNEHILNGCYEVHRKLYQLPRIRTTRFLASFTPQSINVLNGNGMRARKL